MSYIIEAERGTYTGTPHHHNGYYAGDFTHTRRRTAPELAVLTRLAVTPLRPRSNPTR
jgi:hypothetical protein